MGTDLPEHLDRCQRCGEPAPPRESPERTDWRVVEAGDGLHAICPSCQHISEHFRSQSLDKLD
jgi:hypothetical protein